VTAGETNIFKKWVKNRVCPYFSPYFPTPLTKVIFDVTGEGNIAVIYAGAVLAVSSGQF